MLSKGGLDETLERGRLRFLDCSGILQPAIGEVVGALDRDRNAAPGGVRARLLGLVLLRAEDGALAEEVADGGDEVRHVEERQLRLVHYVLEPVRAPPLSALLGLGLAHLLLDFGLEVHQLLHLFVVHLGGVLVRLRELRRVHAVPELLAAVVGRVDLLLSQRHGRVRPRLGASRERRRVLLARHQQLVAHVGRAREILRADPARGHHGLALGGDGELIADEHRLEQRVHAHERLGLDLLGLREEVEQVPVPRVVGVQLVHLDHLLEPPSAHHRLLIVPPAPLRLGRRRTTPPPRRRELRRAAALARWASDVYGVLVLRGRRSRRGELQAQEDVAGDVALSRGASARLGNDRGVEQRGRQALEPIRQRRGVEGPRVLEDDRVAAVVQALRRDGHKDLRDLRRHHAQVVALEHVHRELGEGARGRELDRLSDGEGQGVARSRHQARLEHGAVLAREQAPIHRDAQR